MLKYSKRPIVTNQPLLSIPTQSVLEEKEKCDKLNLIKKRFNYFKNKEFHKIFKKELVEYTADAICKKLSALDEIERKLENLVKHEY